MPDTKREPDIKKEYDMTPEQFIEMMAIQWKYAVKVIEHKNTNQFITSVHFKSSDGTFTAQYRINTAYWNGLKPQIIEKADSLNY